MALFKKGKHDDEFDSPVEEISLSGTPEPQAAAGQTPAAAPAEPAPAAARATPRLANYGIDRAIELMRMLPADNVELVVRVVKTTLESTSVRVSDIIEDAARKQQDIEARIAVLKKEIADLEANIATRKNEIGVLEADHAETTSVKERLILGEKLGAGQSATPADGANAQSSTAKAK